MNVSRRLQDNTLSYVITSDSHIYLHQSKKLFHILRDLVTLDQFIDVIQTFHNFFTLPHYTQRYNSKKVLKNEKLCTCFIKISDPYFSRLSSLHVLFVSVDHDMELHMYA